MHTKMTVKSVRRWSEIKN